MGIPFPIRIRIRNVTNFFFHSSKNVGNIFSGQEINLEIFDLYPYPALANLRAFEDSLSFSKLKNKKIKF
jgi:hypothetical protein